MAPSQYQWLNAGFIPWIPGSQTCNNPAGHWHPHTQPQHICFFSQRRGGVLPWWDAHRASRPWTLHLVTWRPPWPLAPQKGRQRSNTPPMGIRWFLRLVFANVDRNPGDWNPMKRDFRVVFRSKSFFHEQFAVMGWFCHKVIVLGW